jgi:hypothetical protein
MSEDARLAHFYYAFGIVFLRNAYHCVFGPRRHLAEFADGLCRHGNARLDLDPHTTRQTSKSNVKGGNAFGLIFHWASSLADRGLDLFSYRGLMALVVAVVAAVAVAAAVWAWEVERPQMLACA